MVGPKKKEGSSGGSNGEGRGIEEAGDDSSDNKGSLRRKLDRPMKALIFKKNNR